MMRLIPQPRFVTSKFLKLALCYVVIDSHLFLNYFNILYSLYYSAAELDFVNVDLTKIMICILLMKICEGLRMFRNMLYI